MRDIAIDLGTANTVVAVRDRGVVLDEPTVVAMNERTGEVLGVGEEAWGMIGRTGGSVVAVRPLRHGAITDFDVAQRMISILFARAGVGRFSHPRALITVRRGVAAVERRALEQAALSAGSRSVSLIDEPVAAALGAGLPIDQPAGSCIVDCGGGITEVAVISMGSVVSSASVTVGGLDLDEEIRTHLAREHGLAIGERTAEALKKELAAAFPDAEDPKAEVRGREIATGMPKTAIVGADELRRALDHLVRQIVEGVRTCMASTPPELAHDVLDRGITLTGGGALLRGLDARMRADTGIPIRIAEEPLHTVIEGARRAIGSYDRLRAHGIISARR